MKLTKKTKLLTGLLSVAVAGLLTSHASAQVTVTVSPGDLLLAFQQQNNADDYVLDIGQASYYIGLSQTPGVTDITTTKSLGSFSTDLASQYGSGWATYTGTQAVQWGVVGESSKLAAVGSIPKDTYFVTEAAGTAAPGEHSTSSQSSVLTNIGNFEANGNGVGNATSTSHSNYGVLDPSSGADSYTHFTPSTSAFGSGLDIESSTSAGLAQEDLYEVIPTGQTGSTGEGTLLGYFTLNGDTLDFTSAAEQSVPEPSTYALIFSGIGALLLFHRFRRNSIRA